MSANIQTPTNRNWSKLLKGIATRIKRQAQWGYSLMPGVIAATSVITLWTVGAWRPLERLGYNSLFLLREEIGILPNPGWDERIAVIAIDEASLNEYGSFPLPRHHYADLLDLLAISQPAVIGFDLLFAESMPGDARLAQAIFDSGNVVLAVGGDEQGQAIELAEDFDQMPEGSRLLGHIQHSQDADGISRQVSLYEGNLPSLGISMLQLYDAVLSHTVSVDLTHHTDIQLYIPDPAQKLKALINWPGKVEAAQPEFIPHQLQVYSLVDVLNDTIAPNVFQNQIVLVGVTATGLDRARSPFNHEPPIGGVFIHAAVIDNMLNNRLLNQLPNWAAIALLVGLSLGTSKLLSNQDVRGRLAIAIGFPCLWAILALLCFTGNWWIPTAAPIGAIGLTVAGVQLQEQREKQQLMNLFAMHVAPEMADLIWQRKEEIFKDGEMQAQDLTATVLFVDIRGFTSISEKLSSRELLTWLNRYFEVMTDCIMDHGGVVDKYIGDEIMAVFGVPFPHTHPDEISRDAGAAIAACLDMHQRLQELNQEFAAAGRPTIRFGIGVHTGPVTVGSVGSRKRINYSVFGDTVNIAARLQEMTKQTLSADSPYQLLVTGRTYFHVHDHYQGQAVGAIKLRGREKATVVYAITGTR
ncbi:MAG: adenylate/guanylate cyclase domain-containing protein [Leptolyngbyaceae cyanobacterium MO_188.B28]|nr:adenylate/guanylate cyclase domain-containing protein [Leptolyngbyaceae cyanobacterium MO_188.B28]